MNPEAPPLVLSSGEPAGIGPDVCLMLALEAWPARLAVLADPQVLDERRRLLGLDVRLVMHDRASEIPPHGAGEIQVLPVPVRAPVTHGRLDPRNAEYVLEQLQRAATLCMTRECSALVTAPVQKSVMNEAGIPFSGHTELLAELTGAATPVMMLVGAGLRVALVTTHLPLRLVPDAIDEARLKAVLEVLHRDLSERFRLQKPRIAVLGLNPHAGERGALGREEIDILTPAIEAMAARGLAVEGPLPADTAFTPHALARCDAVLAMYHDQGLTVVKALGFGDVVNVTLGLPIIRTSVDHGTALALAGTGQAKPDSLRAAVRLAIELTQRAPR